MGRVLFEPRVLPCRPSLLPSIGSERPHSVCRIVAGAVGERLKVLQAGIPNAEKRLRPNHRHEFHPKTVLPRLLLAGLIENSASFFVGGGVGGLKVTTAR